MSASLSRTISLICIGAGMAAALLGLIASHFGADKAQVAVCPGQSAVFQSWTITLASILPVTGEGFTALEAQVTVRRGDGATDSLTPQLRQSLTAAPVRGGGASIDHWNGALTASVGSYSSTKGCMAVDLAWRPFANWPGYGAGLALLGALLAAFVWLTKRERPLPRLGLPAKVIVLALIAAVSGYVLLQPGATPAKPPYPRGPTLMLARQSLNEGHAVTNQWIIIADAMTRHGQYAEAAKVLLGAVEKDANNAEAWLALGDALFSFGDGQMNRAAEFAYDRADRAAVQQGKADYVLNALEKSGRGNDRQAWSWRKRQTLPNPASSVSIPR